MDDRFSIARKDRDAWAAIRGFVYQVDMTILRWLALGPEDVLELECGEDIDLLAPMIAEGYQSVKRTLEQVKCLDNSLTLRSGPAREAMISFVEHMEENPTLQLHFRFVTTAFPAEERPALPLTFTPGIVLWERVRTNRFDPAQRAAAIESIATFLQRLTPTELTNAGRWRKLVTVTQDLRHFANFISQFEWSVGANQPEGIVSEIENMLVAEEYAVDLRDARMKHDHLFAFMMRLLAGRKSEARKRLPLNDLRESVNSGVVSSAERQVMDELFTLRSIVAEGFSDQLDRLAGLKQDTEAIRQLLYTGKSSHDSLGLHVVIDEAAIQDSFRGASSALLSWPQETDGQWLERPELNLLENIIASKNHSCTILLGTPGCGKSALLARMGNRLQSDGTTLLAIKTDQLPNGIQSLAELDAHLELKTSIIDSVRQLAARERVVLLVDQLDALSALMDQNTNRLSVVLNLVYRLTAVPNVHLIISCREFDFRYDSRFSSLQSDKVKLGEPSWEAVQSVLTAKNIETAKWPADMRELMRNPQHLNVFVQNFTTDSKQHIFETYQSMLEAMFAKRVVDKYTLLTVAACEKIAAEMSDAEELWIPRISLDQQYPREVDRLTAAGMLQVSGRKIGFRHQTLFDYVRTRAFCTGAHSLSAHVLSRQDAIFLRSTLWATLQALRSSSFERYCIEIGNLWEQPLRRHLRLLLISFLGQVSEPDHREAYWLLPTLDDPLLRGKTLGAIVGNAGWFNKLQSRLPALMTNSDEVLTWQVTMVLQSALTFDRQNVFCQMSRYWSGPTRDMLVLQTVREISEWDEQATSTVEAILARQSVKPYFVVHIAQKAAKSGCGFGARIVAAALTGSLSRGVEQMKSAPVVDSPEKDDLDAAMRRLMNQRRELDPIRGLIDTSDWHGLEEVASIEPGAFVQSIWPWFVELAAILIDRESPWIVQYRGSREIELQNDRGSHHSHIPQALKAAMRLYADQDPVGFWSFTNDQKSSDLLVVHRIMALGFERLARVKPLAVLEYLTDDPRRMALGGYTDRHLETKLVIAAVTSQLTVSELLPLEQAVLAFKMYQDQPGDGAQTRWDRRRWNREHRLRLLRAFKLEGFSTETRKIWDEEEIALPGTRDFDSRIEGGMIESPVSSQQMGKATDEQILNLFDELRDNTGTLRPHSMKGGIDQASHAFATFAKEQPARAIAIIESLEPHTQEQPAANAIHALAELQSVDPHRIIDLIKRLASRGFSSQEFRDWTSWALQKLAIRCQGLDDQTCNILKSWLNHSNADEPAEPENADLHKQPQSLLWSSGGIRIFPHGNFPMLTALSYGYRCRTPPEVDRWLETLCAHLAVTEHVAIWKCLVYELSVLWAASDREKVITFLERLFESYPDALTCFEGTVFLAQSNRWLPAEFFHDCLRTIEKSTWHLREQAIGEIAMLRRLTVPTDQFCRAITDRAICSSIGEPPPTAHRRVGVAFACVHLWADPDFRQSAHEALALLARAGDGYLPEAVMDLFRVSANMPPDQQTEEILNILVENPEFIRRSGASFLADRLKELLSDGFNPGIVAEITRSILVAGGTAIGDIRTSWAGEAGDLIEISITLQRMKNTRGIGLDIFEALMDTGAYEADQVLRDVDRRVI